MKYSAIVVAAYGAIKFNPGVSSPVAATMMQFFIASNLCKSAITLAKDETLPSDSTIDADHAFIFLVDYSIQNNGSFAGLAVTED